MAESEGRRRPWLIELVSFSETLRTARRVFLLYSRWSETGQRSVEIRRWMAVRFLTTSY
jgi:hypothetical protein